MSKQENAGPNPSPPPSLQTPAGFVPQPSSARPGFVLPLFVFMGFAVAVAFGLGVGAHFLYKEVSSARSKGDKTAKKSEDRVALVRRIKGQIVRLRSVSYQDQMKGQNELLRLARDHGQQVKFQLLQALQEATRRNDRRWRNAIIHVLKVLDPGTRRR